MKKHFLKYLAITMAAAFILTGCMEDKEVMPPIPYVAETATKIDINNKSTFIGNYSVVSFTKSQNTNIIGLNSLAGGFIINYNNNALQYNYALKYGGYNNTSAQLAISNNNTGINENDITVSEDGYTITFNTPISYEADGITYTINSIKKNDDNLLIITDNIDVDSFISSLTKLCDPLLPVDPANVKTCGESGAMNYVGYYRIENITCGGTTYTGGTNFVGEMTASADLTNLGSSQVIVPIATKFQVVNDELKSCILNQNQINNSNLYYQNSAFDIDLAKTGGFSASIFANVGLVSVKTDNELERTSYITYKPKNTDYTDMLFNNNVVTMKLRIMQQRNQNDSGIILQSPVTLTNETYFTINNTGM